MVYMTPRDHGYLRKASEREAEDVEERNGGERNRNRQVIPKKDEEEEAQGGHEVGSRVPHTLREGLHPDVSA